MDPIDLYRRIIRVVSFFLEKATHVGLDDLRDFNPAVDELAEDIEKLAGILQVIASMSSYDEQNIAIQATQCAIVMKRIAALVNDAEADDSQLRDLLSELERLTDLDP